MIYAIIPLSFFHWVRFTIRTNKTEHLKDYFLSRQDGVILGDLNADYPYVVSSNWPHIDLHTDTRFTWLIPEGVDTMVTGSVNKTYDRFVLGTCIHFTLCISAATCTVVTHVMPFCLSSHLPRLSECCCHTWHVFLSTVVTPVTSFWVLSSHLSRLSEYCRHTCHVFLSTIVTPVTPFWVLSPHLSRISEYCRHTSHVFLSTVVTPVTSFWVLSSHLSRLSEYCGHTCHVFLSTVITPVTSFWVLSSHLSRLSEDCRHSCHVFLLHGVTSQEPQTVQN